MNLSLSTSDKPDALLFDLDGVLADVRSSYRQAVIQTAKRFGLSVKPEEIERLKQAGNANNDWILTYSLLVCNGLNVSYEDVVNRFQDVYLGDDKRPGLREQESMLVQSSLIPRLADVYPLGIVTGRPKIEARWFLDRFGLSSFFRVVIGMEDAPAKPNPAPVQRALCKLGVSNTWMVGDTPDDIQSALSAGISAVGIASPTSSETLLEAGALFVVPSANQLVDLLP